MKRIMVVGTAGAGKSSLAQALAKKFNLPYIELDTLIWLPGWNVCPQDELKKLSLQKMSAPQWSMCGNYPIRMPIKESQADTIIWLDYSLLRCLWQTFKRSLGRIIHKKECCNGNYETFSRVFFSKDSVLLWVLDAHKKRKQQYTQIIDNPLYKHINFIRLRSPKETKKWIKKL